METALPRIVLIVGGLIGVSLLTKAGLERLGIPPLVAYFGLGLLLRGLGGHALPIGSHAREVLEFLARVGVVVLLFRVGLESNLRGLLKQLSCASLIWLSNVAVSGAAGYVAARYVLGLPLVASLVVAVAMTATSVGIPSQIWREAGALETPNGERFLDVAEMDDISGVIVLAMLFSILPTLRGGGDVLAPLASSAGMLLLKLLGFVLACMLFSLYVEKRFTAFCKRAESPPDPMLLVAAAGLIIAAAAGLLGFSLAVGAFFAGLAFSRDPETVKMDASFSSLYDLFTPFFFIGIGFAVEPAALVGGLGAGGILLVAAVAGKVLGTVPVARLYTGWTAATALGVGMVPRAEITMLVMQKALHRDAVGREVYSGMMLVSVATCLAVPITLRWLLTHRREQAAGGRDA